jgi:PAS domain S-box-containing protein
MISFLPTVKQLPEGHPVQVYYQEAELIIDLLLELTEIKPEEDFEKYFNIFNQLATIETRFARKENQLFPYLEKHGWNGPSQGMWSFHDTLREQIKFLNTYNQERNFEKINTNIRFLIEGIKRLLSIEDGTLFPNAIKLLSKEDWEEFYEGDEEMGWMLAVKPKPFPPVSDGYIHPSMDTETRKHNFDTESTFHYDEGYMTPEQVNLLLKFLPIDITYVDENDKVIFYNRGDNRVFGRSKGIIGREVKFCHPPKSVDMVIRIVDEFKAGTKDVAEFWFNFKGRVIHIRYFAIRDKDLTYRGVIEMSQDITEIQKLTGQKRLLDWD